MHVCIPAHKHSCTARRDALFRACRGNKRHSCSRIASSDLLGACLPRREACLANRGGHKSCQRADAEALCTNETTMVRVLISQTVSRLARRLRAGCYCTGTAMEKQPPILLLSVPGAEDRRDAIACQESRLSLSQIGIRHES